ncbi:MAG TPA: FAD-dependent oxidoreductase, partial [Chloroflexota bacterium]|nr:FAD-dependent oxidoreductase [Chloroflexota bacterium]
MTTLAEANYDYIIVGSGIAGLFTAVLATPHGRVAVVTKGRLAQTNTRWAQGGIAAAVADNDSPELHERDTLVAGAGLCDPAAVHVLC